MHEYMSIPGIVLVLPGYGFFSKLPSRYNLFAPSIFAAALFAPSFAVRLRRGRRYES